MRLSIETFRLKPTGNGTRDARHRSCSRFGDGSLEARRVGDQQKQNLSYGDKLQLNVVSRKHDP